MHYGYNLIKSSYVNLTGGMFEVDLRKYLLIMKKFIRENILFGQITFNNILITMRKLLSI